MACTLGISRKTTREVATAALNRGEQRHDMAIPSSAFFPALPLGAHLDFLHGGPTPSVLARSAGTSSNISVLAMEKGRHMIGHDARSPDPRAAGYFKRIAGCDAAPRSSLRWAVLAGALALLFTPVLPAVAAEPPFSPGLFEASHNHTEAFEQRNLALWTPMLIGGIGSIRPDQGGAVRYGNLAVTREPMSASGRQVLGMYGFVQTPGS